MRIGTSGQFLRAASGVIALATLISCGAFGKRGGSTSGSVTSGFGVLTGTLVFTPPLANASIATVDATGTAGTTPGEVAPNGDFVISPLFAGTYSVTISCPGYAGSPIVGVAVTDGAETTVPTLQMAATVDAGP